MQTPEKLVAALQKRKEEQSIRTLKITDHLVDFSSNDYLGLAQNPEVLQLADSFYQQQDNGATGSRLLNGNKPYHEALEAQLATYFNGEAALLFNSGYTANLGVLSAIPQKGDTILLDERSHICIKEGVRLSRASFFNFKHNDLQDLEARLRRATGTVYVVVESVYSMDGDEVPLQPLVTLCQQYGAFIIIDEAHSTGLFSEKGNGFVCHQQLEEAIFCRVYTFGKAIGAHGACVVGSEVLKQYLINYARSFIYTTAMPSHAVAAIRAAITYREEHHQEWHQLKEHIALFKLLIHEAVPALESEHAIQGVLCNGNEEARNLASHLQAEGFDIRPILSPTVPKGSERVRICLHSFNKKEELTHLCDVLNHYFE